MGSDLVKEKLTINVSGNSVMSAPLPNDNRRDDMARTAFLVDSFAETDCAVEALVVCSSRL
jgi:hypothetical protein